MKNLIVYMSHHGTTQKVADQLAEALGEENTTSVNLNKNPLPDINDYDTILIGGSIYIGQIQTAIKKFCIENLGILLRKRIGLFLCFMNIEKGKEEFDSAFPSALRAHSSANGLFGGELLPDEMNFIEKLIVKKIRGVKENVSNLDHEAIEEFLSVIHN